MTTKTIALTQETGKLERFPDYPRLEDLLDYLRQYQQSVTSASIVHYNDAPSVIVANSVPVRNGLPVLGDLRIPDLTIIFGADFQLMLERRGCEIAPQGKAPDFVLEVASQTDGVVNYPAKRRDYQRYGVTEYWRLDPSGDERQDEPLAGERLADGRYRPLSMETSEDGELRGYSESLGLYVCWEDGNLRFYNPVTRSYLLTHMEVVALNREAALTRRIAELEAEIRRLRGE